MSKSNRDFKEEFPIKRLIASDVPSLSILAHDIFKATYEDLLEGSFEMENFKVYLKKAFKEERLSRELQHANVEYFGIFNQDKLIGYFKLNLADKQSLKKPDNYIEIERFYLDSPHQGIGLGKYMLDWIEARARSLAYEILWLRTWERNDRAIEFYKKMGLKIIGTAEYKFEVSVDVDYVFEKSLQ